MKTIEKGKAVRLLESYGSYKKGSEGTVLALRDVKETDVDVQALKKNGIQMALGQLALVKFPRGRQVIPVTNLELK